MTHAVATALDALNIARLAWERSQPQYVLDLYPDGGLEETVAPVAQMRTGRRADAASAAATVSSSPPSPSFSPEGGLTLPAEKQRCEGAPATEAAVTAIRVSPVSAGPNTYTTGPAATPPSVRRPGQQGEL